MYNTDNYTHIILITGYFNTSMVWFSWTFSHLLKPQHDSGQMCHKRTISHQQHLCKRPIFSYFICTKAQAYPVIRGRVSVEKRAKGGLSLSMSQMVYCPLCLGWRNTAISKPHRPWVPQSHGLKTQGPPKAELLTQKNWPEREENQRVRCSLTKRIRLMLLVADLHFWLSLFMLKKVNFTETVGCKDLR